MELTNFNACPSRREELRADGKAPKCGAQLGIVAVEEVFTLL